MSKRSSLITTVSFIAAFAASPTLAADSKPNIVAIMIDDIRVRWIYPLIIAVWEQWQRRTSTESQKKA